MILITKDQKEKVRYVKVWISQVGDHFIINRHSGAIGGKDTPQPDIIIKEGKVNRTPKEQAELEKASMIKKYLDKGYKDLKTLTPTPFEELTQEFMLQFFPKEEAKKSSSGKLKPMLAKDSNKVKPIYFKRYWRISRKLDGTRLMMKYDAETDKIKAWTRGGQDCNEPIKHITSSPKLVKLLKERPYLVLDGELYCHGVSLEVLSGLSRRKEWSPECAILEYHIFDLAIPNMEFQKREELLDKMANYFMDERKIHIVEHIEVFGWQEIKAYHDKFVGQGYEGAVVRDPTSEYIFGARNNSWLKIKEFKDEEFEITGCTLGLRGSEDMVFDLKTKEGKAFQAKPMGSKAIKEEYVKNIDRIVGKKATIKYFYMTEEGLPFLPVFKNIRERGT